MNLRKGFTLIELLVVVAIIGILVLIAVPRFQSMTQGAKVATVQANHRQIVSAISMYIADNGGKVPATQAALDKYLPDKGTASDGLTALNGKPDGSTYVFDYTAASGSNPATCTLTSKLDGQTIATFTP